MLMLFCVILKFKLQAEVTCTVGADEPGRNAIIKSTTYESNLTDRIRTRRVGLVP